MREYDQLPPELRRWVRGAKLPWRAKTVRAAYDKALRDTGNPDAALGVLDQLQHRLVARDAGRVWGQDHPECGARR